MGTVKDAAWWRAYRASKGARTGRRGPPQTAKCGTISGYERHRKNGETTCPACRKARSEYESRRARERRAATSTPSKTAAATDRNS